MPDTLPPNDQQLPVNIEDEMQKSYLDYAMSVIIGRALPDVRDGLKPVHRRILYGMYEQGNTSTKAYKKSARIVGDVMGKFHPHGDSAIYDSVVRMAQGFSMRNPLVDGQGNFGSVDGDNPAAMRYTEVRLTKLAEELLRDDIDKDTVNWVPNYDGSLVEPAVLPAKFPNLLVNGSSGIAVGMATNIPPHNLGEVIDACQMLIENPEARIVDLMTVLPGPDFPTGATIHGIEGIREAYETGRGSLQIRAKAEIERHGDRDVIVVSEIPFMTNKARLIEKIANLVREKKIEGISDLRDESDREGMRIVIECKKAEVGEIILNNLYKHTYLQSSFGIIFLAIHENRPVVMDLKTMLVRFLEHRKEIVIRRTRFDLRKAKDRAHILEGLKKALDHLDAIIALIRGSQNPEAAREGLMSQFDFSQVQAQAILDMRLQRLTGLERDKIIEEYKEILELISRLEAILGSEQLVLQIISDELKAIKEAYSDPRRTGIVLQSKDITIEDMIADEEMVITVSRGGYIKRSPLTTYREQRRGGKGKIGMVPKEEDIVEHLFVATAHSYILVFTDRGRVYWLKVHQLPQIGSAARGKAIVNLLPVEKNENVRALLSVRDFEDAKYVMFITKSGRIKKTELRAFSNPRASGIIAIGINDDDDLLSVGLADADSQIFIGTRRGMAIRFAGSDVRPMGRSAAGVKGIKLSKDDVVVDMAVLDPGAPGEILTVTELGYGKRTEREAYRLQGRGGKGVTNIRTTEKNGLVVGILSVTEDDQVLLITKNGKIIRTSCASIRSVGRATQGVTVINTEDDDAVVASVKVVEREDDEVENGDADPDGERNDDASVPEELDEPVN